MDQAERQAAIVGGAVDVVEAEGQLLADVEGQRQGQAPRAGPAIEIAAVDVLEDDVVAPGVEAQAEHRHQVAVGQAPAEAGLVDERLLEGGLLGQLGDQALDRDHPLEAGGAKPARLPDLGHPAAPEPALEAVRADGGPDGGADVEVGHGRA